MTALTHLAAGQTVGFSRVIASHVGPRAFAPRTRKALRALGYELLSSEAAGRHPDLRIVDERHLDRIPSPEEEPDVPVVLLTGARPQSCEDPRVCDRISRPAELNDAFAAFQRALEPYPRRSPRIATKLPARIIRADRRSPGAILSISERGCLLRSPEPFASDTTMNLQFALPNVGLLHVRARCIGAQGEDQGIAFDDPSASLRQTLAEYVGQLLMPS